MPGIDQTSEDPNYDDYDLDDGFATEYAFTVTDAFFATDAEYNNGQTLRLELHGEAIIDGLAVEQQLKYSTGKDWEAADNGKRAVSVMEGKPNRSFNKNSGVGRLISAAVEVVGVEKMRDLGRAREASTWIGTKWHLLRHTSTFKARDTGEEREWSIMLPDEFLGKSGDGPSPTPGVSTSSTPTSTPASNGNGHSPATTVKLRRLGELAQSTDDFDTFMEKGLEIAGGDTDVENCAIDNSWYQSARSGS